MHSMQPNLRRSTRNEQLLVLFLEYVVMILSNINSEDIEDTSLEGIFAEDDSDVMADASDSDGFLSEVEVVKLRL